MGPVTDAAGLATVRYALGRGLRVVWEPSPRFRGPAEVVAQAQEAPETAKEVLRRATVFRAQLRVSGVIPILVLPGAPATPGGCLSCGVPCPLRLRCGLCQVAAWLALDLVPPEEPGA